MRKIIFVILMISTLLVGCESTNTAVTEEISVNTEISKNVAVAKPAKEIVFANDTAESTDKVEVTEPSSVEDMTTEEVLNSDLSEEDIYEIMSNAIDTVEGQSILISIKHDAIDYEEDGVKVKLDASDSTMHIDANNNMHLKLNSNGQNSDMWLIGDTLYLNEDGKLSKGTLEDSGSSTEEITNSFDMNELKESYKNPKVIADNMIEFEVSEDNSMQEAVNTVEHSEIYKGVMLLNDDGSLCSISMVMADDQSNYSITMSPVKELVELPMSFDDAKELTSDEAAWAFMMAVVAFMM